MTTRPISDNVITDLVSRVDQLNKRLKAIENRKLVNLPMRDYLQLPTDADEGDIVAGTDESAWVFLNGAWIPIGAVRGFVANWGGGTMPTATGSGTQRIIPTDIDGVSLTFELQMLYARVDPVATGDVTFRIDYSADGGAFSGTAAGSITIDPGDYDGVPVALTGTVESGDLLQIEYVDVGATGKYWVQIIAKRI